MAGSGSDSPYGRTQSVEVVDIGGTIPGVKHICVKSAGASTLRVTFLNSAGLAIPIDPVNGLATKDYGVALTTTAQVLLAAIMAGYGDSQCNQAVAAVQIHVTGDDVYWNYGGTNNLTIDTDMGPSVYDNVLSAGGPYIIGRGASGPFATSPSGGGTGGTTTSTAETIDLELYAMRSVTGTVTLVLDMLNSSRQFTDQISISVGTTAKSLRAFVEDVPITWEETWKFALVRSITGGTIYYNQAGDLTGGDPGILAGQAPTATGTNSDQLVAGQMLGEV